MDYQSKKSFYANIITLYGRKPALEALQDPSLQIHRLHLAQSNRPHAIIDQLSALANQRNIEILFHSKQELSRISKSSKQDQGVALDIVNRQLYQLDDWLADNDTSNARLIALDGIHNPQNLGMIIRSCAASGIDGLLLSDQGNAALGPLVIKASAGTLFKAPIIRCDSLITALTTLNNKGLPAYALRGDAETELADIELEGGAVFVLGNETDGVSKDCSKACKRAVRIAMHNNVESLNVAVTAALVAFQIAAR